MPPPYCYDYPRPAVTVDLAVFRREGDGLRVLLIRRKKDPFAGSWALPGGFIEIEEPIEAAARRELLEETGFKATEPIGFVGVFGDPGRDPRGRTISMAYATAVRRSRSKVLGGDDAAEASWHDPWQLGRLAFDHNRILTDAIIWLQGATLAGSLNAALLPSSFEKADVTALFTCVRLDKAKATPWLRAEVNAGRILKSDTGYSLPKGKAVKD